MPGTGHSAMVDALRRLIDDAQLTTCPDEQLLSRFVHAKDEAAFQVLLHRHGPMVLDVCTSLLPNEADAEDAFQACFLLLASRARSIRKAKSLAAWLHGVAYRIARKARTEFARRQKHESRRGATEEATPDDDLSWREVRQLVHEELNRLPQRYRQVLMLCYLQGKRQDQVAQELGIPKGTLKGRLERGRHLLRTRLIRRGLGPGASLIAMVWPACETSGSAHATCVMTTATAAVSLAGRKGITGLVSPRVAGLVTGALNAMLISKATIYVAAVGLLVAMTYAFSLIAGTGTAQPPGMQQGVEAKRDGNPAPQGEKEPGWVKSDDGVLALRLAIKPGQPIELTASLRNLSDKPVNVLRPFGDETATRMTWLDIRGPQGKLKSNLPHGDNHPLVFTRLEPGETVKDALKVDPSQYEGMHRPGRYTIRFEYTYDGNGDKVAEKQGLVNIWRGKIRSKPVILTIEEDLEGWVKSDDGVLALRLTGGAGKPEEPIQIIVSLRNRSDRPVNVLRPCGDDYQARSVFVDLQGPKGKLKYTGDIPDYTLGKQAFVTLAPGDTISDPLAITVDNRQGSDAAGEYRITFTYEATPSNRTWAEKQYGLADLWTGRIRSLPITVRKVDTPSAPADTRKPGAANPSTTPDPIAPHASGVALAEVVDIKPYNNLESDGDKGLLVKLRRIRGTGQFRDTIDVVTDFGRSSPDRKPEGPATADSFKKGERYWIVFSSDRMRKYPQGIIAFWPEDSPTVAPRLEAAIRADAYRWQPQYDPETGFTIGHLSGTEEGSWRLRVAEEGKVLWETAVGGKVLWETTVPGIKWVFNLGLGFYNQYDGFPANMPPGDRILVAPSKVEVGMKNDFDLPAGEYSISTGFDPRTGRRLAVWVFHIRKEYRNLLYRDYSSPTGNLIREDRFEYIEQGGRRIGAKTEEWWRRTSRAFDPRTGKVVSETVFRFEPGPDASKWWVKIQP